MPAAFSTVCGLAAEQPHIRFMDQGGCFECLCSPFPRKLGGGPGRPKRRAGQTSGASCAVARSPFDRDELCDETVLRQDCRRAKKFSKKSYVDYH